MGGGRERHDSDGTADQTPFGRRPNGIYVAALPQREGRSTPTSSAGYGFQGGAGRAGWGRGTDCRASAPTSSGAARANPGPGSFWLRRLGRVPAASTTTRVELDPDAEGHVGHSGAADQLHLRRPTSGRCCEDMQITAAEMLEAAGRHGHHAVQRAQPARALHPRDGHGPDGPGPEDLGAQRPQPGAGTSPNLFVTDGACMASSAQPESVASPTWRSPRGPARMRWICCDGGSYERTGNAAAGVRGDAGRRRCGAGARVACPSVPAPAPLASSVSVYSSIRSATCSSRISTARSPASPAIGYREVEFAGYFDHTPEQVRAALDRNGLTAPGGARAVRGDRERLGRDAAYGDARSAIVSWCAPGSARSGAAPWTTGGASATA